MYKNTTILLHYVKINSKFVIFSVTETIVKLNHQQTAYRQRKMDNISCAVEKL